jgi:hypothetical protein
VQINIRAGELPPKEDNGISYLKIPLNALWTPLTLSYWLDSFALIQDKVFLDWTEGLAQLA